MAAPVRFSRWFGKNILRCPTRVPFVVPAPFVQLRKKTTDSLVSRQCDRYFCFFLPPDAFSATAARTSSFNAATLILWWCRHIIANFPGLSYNADEELSSTSEHLF